MFLLLLIFTKTEPDFSNRLTYSEYYEKCTRHYT